VSDKRLRVCLDSCHLHASGYDMRTEESIADVVDDFDRVVGLDRLASLHVNDSMTPLALQPRPAHQPRRRRDRRHGQSPRSSASRAFEGLPAIFEGPGYKGKAVEPEDIENMIALRKRGVTARKR